MSSIAYTTNPQKWAPSGASGAVITPTGVAWTNSAAVQIIASAAADLVISGLTVWPGASDFFGTPDCQFEIDVCIGGAGSETPVGTFKGGSRVQGSAPIYDNHNTFPLVIGSDVIPSGSRVSLILRNKSTYTGTWKVVLGYYENPIVGTMPTTTQPLRCAPAAADLITIATSNAFADPGSFTTIIASAAADLAIVGLVIQPNNNSLGEYELVLGKGGAGSETIVFRDVGFSQTYWESPQMFPVVNPTVAFSAGDRISAKAYGNTGGTTALNLGLMYYHRPL